MEAIAQLERLDALFGKGAIDEAEFSTLKASVLSSAARPQPESRVHTTTTNPEPSPVERALITLGSCMEKLVHVCARPMEPVPPCATPSAASIPPPSPAPAVRGTPLSTVRPADASTATAPPPAKRQRTLLSCGVNLTRIDKDGREWTTTPSSSAPLAKTAAKKRVFSCGWCDFTTTHAPALATHERGHTGPRRAARSLLDFSGALNSLQSEEQQEKMRRREVSSWLTELITTVIKNGEGRGDPDFMRFAHGKRRGGRNSQERRRGAAKRTARSSALKAKVINEFEASRKQFASSSATDVAVLVGIIFEVTGNQVQTWYRNRDAILAEAKGKNKNKLRKTKKRARFEKAEKAVYEQFSTARKKGQRVSARWLRQCARREVSGSPSTPVAVP